MGPREFEDICRATPAAGDPALSSLLRVVHAAYTTNPADAPLARQALIALFEYLSSPAGRTNANCAAADGFLILNPVLRATRALPAKYFEILDEADCLHDTFGSPEIAENCGSTPEQLLAKARSL